MMTAGPFGGPMDGPRGPMNSNEMPLGPRGSMSNKDGPMGGPRMLGNGPMNANDVPMGGPRMPGNDVGMGRPPPSRDNQNNQQRNFGSNNFSSNGLPPPANPDPSQNSGRPIDLRIILSRDEVAFLFGFDGNLINQLRQQTGAHIQITEGESFEYVLLISGAVDIIFKAFSLVCRKLWDLLTKIAGPGHNRPLKIRIAVPAVQCGSIIGKAGAKVKEIRDLTGAQIQVSHEPLPNSTERCVEISGSGESCLQCTYHICCVMQEAPLRGEVIPYIPPVNGGPPGGGPGPQHGGPPMGMPPAGPGGMDSWRPVFLCGDKAFIIEGPIARPAPPELLRRELAKTPLGGDVAESLANNTMSSNMPDHMNPLALMAAISKSQQNGGQNQQPQTSREMTVNSEMINIMMAQSQGQKIEEIRRMSGAQIHISDQQGGPGSNPGDQLITLSGSEESILLAQFLIQANVDTIIKERREAKSQFPPPSGPSGGPGGPPPGVHPMGGRGGPNPMQQGPPPQMHQNHQNNLHPTNQFDPSIMQQNFQDEKQNSFQGGHPGGPPGHQGGGGNPHLQPPPFQQQDQGGFHRNQGGPPPGGQFRNNSGDGPGRFQGGPHGMGGPGSNPGRGGRGDRRSPMGDRGDNRRGGRRGRR